MILSLTILDIIMGGTVSQIVDLCLGIHSMKYGKYRLKKYYIKNLRHRSLHYNVMDKWLKLYRWMRRDNRNNDVQKIKVKSVKKFNLIKFRREQNVVCLIG